jgi:hypothetical protein
MANPWLLMKIDLQGHEKEGKTPKRVSVPFQTGGLCVSAPDPRPCILSKEPPQWPGMPQAGCGRNLSPIIERKTGGRTLKIALSNQPSAFSPEAFKRTARSGEEQHHQDVIDIFIANLERVRFDAIAFKSQRRVTGVVREGWLMLQA